MSIGSDPTLSDVDLGPHAIGRMLGELAVHREAYSRVWSGSPEALECILNALTSTGAKAHSQDSDLRFFDLPTSAHDISFQTGAGRV